MHPARRKGNGGHLPSGRRQRRLKLPARCHDPSFLELRIRKHACATPAGGGRARAVPAGAVRTGGARAGGIRGGVRASAGTTHGRAGAVAAEPVVGAGGRPPTTAAMIEVGPRTLRCGRVAAHCEAGYWPDLKLASLAVSDRPIRPPVPRGRSGPRYEPRPCGLRQRRGGRPLVPRWRRDRGGPRAAPTRAGR